MAQTNLIKESRELNVDLRKEMETSENLIRTEDAYRNMNVDL